MFVFTERTGRAEFWWFAGPWLAASIPLLLYAATLVHSSDGFKVWLAAFIALNLPVLSASVRRALYAGKDSSKTSFAGWGFVWLMGGPSAHLLQKTVPEKHPAGFFLGLMLLAPPP